VAVLPHADRQATGHNSGDTPQVTTTQILSSVVRVSIHLALCIARRLLLSNSLYMPSETAKSPEVARLVPAMALGERQIPISRARQIPISRARVFGEAPAEVW
jgi:hypothetical protein